MAIKIIQFLLSVFEDLSSVNQKAIKIIKSTVVPNTLKMLEKKYSNIVYNPEFLRKCRGGFYKL